MRAGIAFPHTHPHEAVHLRPLMQRLRDVAVLPRDEPKVAVHATAQPPVRGAWNVQVFHGLGDKGYVLNPVFLQRRRWPRARTALNMAAAAVHLPGPFLRPPGRPGTRGGRYEQVNAYGPRFRDALEPMVRGTLVTGFGHVALNDRADLRPDPHGPIVWVPTWDNRRFMGGAPASGLASFAGEVARLAGHVPVVVKFHPLTVRHRQAVEQRKALARAPGVRIAEAEGDPYEVLRGARAVLTDTSSLGFEAYCLGFPVAIARPPGPHPGGLHGELEERVPVLSPHRPDLANWAEQPDPSADGRWAQDLLFPPSPQRNDAFAGQLRSTLSA